MHMRLDRFEDWPQEPPVRTRFVLFIEMDARDLPNDELRSTARRIIRHGAAWICLWGADSERAHDLFDQAAVELDRASGSSTDLMTSWHSSETLVEALWFFATCALPTDFDASSHVWLAVSVGTDPRDETLRLLREPDLLFARLDREQKARPS